MKYFCYTLQILFFLGMCEWIQKLFFWCDYEYVKKCHDVLGDVVDIKSCIQLPH